MKQTLNYLNNLHERDIHPFLVRYLAKKLNIYSKTVYHESSAKGSKGKNEWLHPDVVGFNLPVEGWNEKVLELCETFSINRATIYSFELKKSITVETLREQFFQAVSNSSWANEGYLVGVDIDINNIELMQEINRLSSAFGIGVIKLNLINCEESEILFPAMRKHVLDGETMNKLFKINPDFCEFVKVAIASIKINHPVVDKFDAILSTEDLQIILDNSIRPNDIHDVSDNQEVYDIEEHNKYMSIDANLIGQKPRALVICGECFEVTSWRKLYIKVCEYIIDKDPMLFVEATKRVHGETKLYFSNNKADIKKDPYLLDKINIYAERHFGPKCIIRNIKKLAKECNINPTEIKIAITE